MILVGIIEKERLWFYQDARGRVLETPYSYIFQYLVYAAVPILALFLFTVFIGVVVYGFLGYHLWLISRGTTTNETFKWQDFEEDQQLLKKQQQKRAKNSSIPVDDFEDEFADLPLVKAKPITNIYHRGVFKNFSEVFFPLAEETRHPASSFPPSPAKTSAAPNALPKMPLKHENKKRRWIAPSFAHCSLSIHLCSVICVANLLKNKHGCWYYSKFRPKRFLRGRGADGKKCSNKLTLPFLIWRSSATLH